MRAREQIRKEVKQTRQRIPRDMALRQAEQVAAHVRAWPVYRAAQAVLLYVAMGDELGTATLLDAVLADKKTLLVPRCGARGHMDAVAVADWRALPEGRFGLSEPPMSAPAFDPMDIDLALLPALAFDLSGNRLGWGAGYYDRFLPRTRAVAAGLAFSEQIVPHIPPMPHDVPVQYLITPQGIAAAMHKERDAHGTTIA